jgi:hypothetical protein
MSTTSLEFFMTIKKDQTARQCDFSSATFRCVGVIEECEELNLARIGIFLL